MDKQSNKHIWLGILTGFVIFFIRNPGAALFLLLVIVVGIFSITDPHPPPSKSYRLQVMDSHNNLGYGPISKIYNDHQWQEMRPDDSICAENNGMIVCKNMPVVLEYFTIYRKDDNTYAVWNAKVEDNILKYILQESDNGKVYQDILSIEPKGVNSKYEFKIN